MILVVGSTGLLGAEVVRVLREVGTPVRAMVRPSADSAKRRSLEEVGAAIVSGDLKHPESVAEACQGVTTVISTASATLSRQQGDSIAAVDHQGQLGLVEQATRAGVKRFVFVSFAPAEVDFELQRSKRAVEAALKSSGMEYSILHPVDFMEVWLSPALGFSPGEGKARVFGNGRAPVSWVSYRDVARFAAAAAEDSALIGKVVELGGPDALSPLEVIDIFKELGAPEVAIDHVPTEALEAQLAGAQDPVSEAFAALMLNTARGYVVNPRPALALVPGQLISVRDYANQTLKASSEARRST